MSDVEGKKCKKWILFVKLAGPGSYFPGRELFVEQFSLPIFYFFFGTRFPSWIRIRMNIML